MFADAPVSRRMPRRMRRPIIAAVRVRNEKDSSKDKLAVKRSQSQMEAADNLPDLCVGLGDDREVVDEIEITVAPGDYAWY